MRIKARILSIRVNNESSSRERQAYTWWQVFLVIAIMGVLAALLLPDHRGVREAARRVQCGNNLRQIGLALHHYHDEYQSFPPAYTVNEAGQPLHSWRTLILPFLEQQHLYESVDLSKPWHDPANEAAFKTAVPVYLCPSAEIDEIHTTYMGMVGPDACLHPTKPRSLSEITDGTSETLMVIETSPQQAVHWMAPQDEGVQFLLSFNEEDELDHDFGMNVLFADGSARFVTAAMSDAARQALVTVDGGETIGEW